MNVAYLRTLTMGAGMQGAGSSDPKSVIRHPGGCDRHRDRAIETVSATSALATMRTMRSSKEIQ
jgi:hypothetical protein